MLIILNYNDRTDLSRGTTIWIYGKLAGDSCNISIGEFAGQSEII